MELKIMYRDIFCIQWTRLQTKYMSGHETDVEPYTTVVLLTVKKVTDFVPPWEKHALTKYLLTIYTVGNIRDLKSHFQSLWSLQSRWGD